MPEYVYKAVNRNGLIVKNKVEEASKQALIKKLKGMKAQVAFGPFLCLGLAIAVFAGEKIIDLYISFLGF